MSPLETDAELKKTYQEILTNPDFRLDHVEDEKFGMRVVTLKYMNRDLGNVGFTISTKGIVEIGYSPHRLNVYESERGKG